jgi:rare lipoprotein A
VTLWSCVTRILISVLAVLLTACVSAPSSQTPQSTSPNGGRYQLENDSGELEPMDLSKVRPVVPSVETRTAAGNKSPYTINGVTYHILASEDGYTETGLASWYGRKFHGHLTSNGEIYDMFQVSAAHTRLPIPSYVRITNLDNDSSIIARVNDRGPFHPGRIVDLSYAGAVLLGYADKGTARVKVEALVPARNQPQAVAPVVYSADSLEAVAIERKQIEANTGKEFLQVGAFANIESAQKLVARLTAMTRMPVFIASDAADNGTVLHKVRVGPLAGDDEAQLLIESVEQARLGSPFKVRI